MSIRNKTAEEIIVQTSQLRSDLEDAIKEVLIDHDKYWTDSIARDNFCEDCECLYYEDDVNYYSCTACKSEPDPLSENCIISIPYDYNKLIDARIRECISCLLEGL